jgi:hypothetical protein
MGDPIMASRASSAALALGIAGLAASLCACGHGGGGGTAGSNPSGIVGRLTGDPDDEVTPALEDQVFRAVKRGEDDDPIPD